jgi:hypothetical protein
VELERSLPLSKEPIRVPALSRMNPFYLLTSCLLKKTSILSSHLPRILRSGPFPSGFAVKFLCQFIIDPVCSRCPARLILLYLMILVIFCESRPAEYNAPHAAVSSSCSILPIRSVSKDPYWGLRVITPGRGRPSCTPYETTVNIGFIF